MGDSQEQVRKDILGGKADEKAKPVKEKKPPAPPPAATFSRMVLTWRIALSVLLAVAVLNTGVSLYVSHQARWPTSAEALIQKGRVAADKLKSYGEGVARHAQDVLQGAPRGGRRWFSALGRLILALAILAFVVRLLMESQVVGEAMAVANPPLWTGPKAYPFELVATIGLGGLLTWLGVLVRSHDQFVLQCLLAAYLVAHGLWMIVNFAILGGRRGANTGRFLGLGFNSLIFAGVLIASILCCPYFQDTRGTAPMAALVCLASSVIGVRIVADSFLGGERRGKAARDIVFVIIWLALLALVCLAILARG